MIRLPQVILTAIIALATLNAAGLAGSWKGSMETQMGLTELTITFRPGTELAGAVKSEMFEAAIEKASLDGDKIAFEINIDPGKVSFEGTVSGDEMKLSVTGTTGNKYQLICKRQR